MCVCVSLGLKNIDILARIQIISSLSFPMYQKVPPINSLLRLCVSHVYRICVCGSVVGDRCLLILQVLNLAHKKLATQALVMTAHS